MKKKILLIPLALLLAMSLVVTGCPAPAPVEKITLTAISAWKPDQWMTAKFIEFLDELNKRAPDGRLEIRYAGGPEIITARDQLTAVGEGTIDMFYSYSGYFSGVVPEIGIVILPVVERTRDNFVKLGRAIKGPLGEIVAEKTNTKLLAVHGPCIMSLVTREAPLTKLADLKGLKTRTTGGWDEAMLAALGTAPTKIPSPEIYTAAERGVIDAASRPISAVHSWREYEVWNYITPLPMYAIDGVMFMNLDVFNGLPTDLREFLVDIIQEWEPIVEEYYIKYDDEVLAKLVDLGMEVIELSPAETAKYREIQLKAALEYFPKISPEHHKVLTDALKAAAR